MDSPANYYFSLQFSAIQKAVLRHDRLWSIAGISNALAKMNEITMPEIARENNGEAIVAGGGKFTARFKSEEAAQRAKDQCVRLVSTTLPMLEFQVSGISAGETFQSLKNDDNRNRLIAELDQQKRQFRGYAVSFNPHLKLCDECGEYPAIKPHWREEGEHVCRICDGMNLESRKLNRKIAGEKLTTLQRVYADYLGRVGASEKTKPAADFKDLFPESNDERKRMAVWFSDLNNMNDKVPVWLNQKNELDVLKTFDEFRSTVVEIIVRALVRTFPKPSGGFLPFRLVVAGGDDLCLVMAEGNILEFTRNISAELMGVKNGLPKTHPLSDAWLMEHGDFEGNKPKPFSFGGSFVVTSVHTPFSQIHAIGEELMCEAKKKTRREGNSVNWRVMAEDRPLDDEPFVFDRPLFIEKKRDDDQDHLSFNDFLRLRKKYSTKPNKISTSHLQQIVALMLREKNPCEIERQMKLLDSSEADKSFSPLLRDRDFRMNGDLNQPLIPARIATLFELLTIAGGNE